MVHREPRGSECTDPDRFPRSTFDPLDLERKFDIASPREEGVEQFVNALANARRACNRERPRAVGIESGIEQEEGDSTVVIPMEVAEQNPVDVVRVESEPTHGRQCRRAAIDQIPRPTDLEQELVCIFPPVPKASPEPRTVSRMKSSSAYRRARQI